MNDTSKEAHGIQQPSVRKRGRVDAVSLVGGLVFVAVAVTVLVGKYWVEVDAVPIEERAGRLVRPFDRSLSTPLTFSYYLLSAKDSAEQPKVAAFRDWLIEEVRASRPEACEEP